MKQISYLQSLKLKQAFSAILVASGIEEMLKKKVGSKAELMHSGTDYDYSRGAVSTFPCGKCENKVEVSFRYMQSCGTEFTIDEIVNKFKAISEKEILHKKVAVKGNPRYRSAEEYSIFGSTARAKISACSDCGQPHLTSFCTAEHQPGRDSTMIEGTWMLKRSNRLSQTVR